jgi:hypothetical protein
MRSELSTTYKEVVMVTEMLKPANEERAADLQAALNAAMVEVGDKFGLYEAMAQSGPVTSPELAQLTGLPWRQLCVWLEAQAAGDFLDYDEATGQYSLWCSWPRRHGGGHTYRGDAVRQLLSRSI